MSRIENTIRRTLHWFALVWPRWWLLATLLIVWAGTEWIYLSTGFSLGNWEMLRPCLFARDAVLIFAAASYGMYRGIAFHPVLHDAYYEWLSSTPWTRSKPLPLGPVLLVPQDALFIAPLVALGLHQPATLPVVIPLTFLGCYIAASCLGQAHTGPTWSVHLLLLGLVGVIRLTIASPLLGLSAAVGLAGIAQFSLWLALGQFPWRSRLAAIRAHSPPSNEIPFRRGGNFRRRSSDPGNHEMLRLWPFRQLHVDPRESLLRRGDYWLLGLLAGLFAYALASGIPDSKDDEGVVRFFCFAIAAASAGWRLISYCQFHHPPISLLGRLRTRKWIIPEYDVVFVAPLLALLCGIVIPTILLAYGILPSVALGTTIAIALWIAWLGGPDKQRWQLTSPCRIVHLGAERRSIEEI